MKLRCDEQMPRVDISNAQRFHCEPSEHKSYCTIGISPSDQDCLAQSAEAITIRAFWAIVHDPIAILLKHFKTYKNWRIPWTSLRSFPAPIAISVGFTPLWCGLAVIAGSLNTIAPLVVVLQRVSSHASVAASDLLFHRGVTDRRTRHLFKCCGLN